MLHAKFQYHMTSCSEKKIFECLFTIYIGVAACDRDSDHTSFPSPFSRRFHIKHERFHRYLENCITTTTDGRQSIRILKLTAQVSLSYAMRRPYGNF